MKKLTILFFLALASPTIAKVNIDSLWQAFNDPDNTDTLRLSAIKTIAWDGFLFSNPDSAFYYANLQLEFAKKVGNEMMQGSAFITMGATHYIKGELVQAIEYYKKSLAIVEAMGDDRGISATLNNLGAIYYSKGAYDKAISYYTRSLQLDEKRAQESVDPRAKKGMAIAYNNIGNIYWVQEEYEISGEYYKKSMALQEEIDFKPGIAGACNNLGLYYSHLGESEKAMNYFERCLEISREIGDAEKEADALNGIGTEYSKRNDLQRAMQFFEESLEKRTHGQDKVGQSSALTNIASTHRRMGNYSLAIEKGKQALNSAREVEAIEEQRDATLNLYETYKELGQGKTALQYYEGYVILKDSLQRDENKREILNQEFKYEYEKKEAIAKANYEADLQHEKEIAEEQKQQQNIIIASITLGLVIVLIFSAFLYNRFKITQRQKQIIQTQKTEVERQKDLVEEKNQQITDSIRYAKRIQGAILPPLKLVKSTFNDSFILYKPKDIVAGDFYWMEQIKLENEGAILFAAADCTGHGVPGALVSVVCNNGLNRAVREFGLTDPGQILDKTRELVIKEFEKSEEAVQDGMDIALCLLLGKKLKYSGAHNPLWIIRAGGNTVEEIKANKQPIGLYEKLEPYQSHSIDLNAGDSIYIFSDGMADQFGGPKGKKFMSSNFKKLLLSIQGQDMEQQGASISKAFEDWRGSNPQLDDVCVIGVRV